MKPNEKRHEFLLSVASLALFYWRGKGNVALGVCPLAEA
jgi:hypothetical protein